MDRRYFLKASGIGLASFGLMGLAPNFLQQFASAATRTNNSKRPKTLITIFQRGAVDGLNVVVPYGDSHYYDLRRTIAIAKPGQTDGAIRLDDTFALHPALAPFENLFKNNQLAVIHAAGSPDNTRSHFDAQDYMESGTPGVKSTPDGWLNRVLQNNAKDASPFQAVAMTNQLPRSLYGRAPSVAMTNLSDFAIRAGSYSPNVQGGFEAIYAQTVSGDTLGATGKETFEAINLLKKSNPSQYKPENGAVYPNTQLGNSLKQIAQLVKSGVGLEIAFAEAGGWDTHANEGGARGQLSNLLRDFGLSITALATDLGARMDDVVILTMSEFGRTARENGTRGTDHGHANAMFVIGNSVKGGKVYGDFRGLADDKLNEGRDLALTTDFRDVFAEVADKHLGNKDFGKIFPGYNVSMSNRRNFLG